MFLQINEINIQDNGRIDMRLEYDESFRRVIAKHYKKDTITKKEIMAFIVEKLDSLLENDPILAARLNDSKPDDE